MDTLNATDVSLLIGDHTPPCVSVYLPTHPAGAEGQQDPVRLKNLLQQAEQMLADGWMRPTEARQFLHAARELPVDPAFWGARSEGLALFVAPELFRSYRLRLPFEESVVVDRRFRVAPLLPLMASDGRFFILALSQNNVRLYSATQYAIELVEVPDLPANIHESLNYTSSERGAQVHSAMRGDRGKQAAVFHGQGGQADAHKDDLQSFFRLVDAALQPVLRDQTVPLLLAGVDYLLPIYRSVASYQRVIEPALVGNCDYLSAHELHQQAWPIVEPVLRQATDNAVQRFRELAGTSRISCDIKEIVPASIEGRVESLLADVQLHLWGRQDPSTGSLEIHLVQEPGDDDLLDLAVAETLRHSGAAYSLPAERMPESAPVAAVFRY